MPKQSLNLAPGARVMIRDEEWMVLSAAPAMQKSYSVRAVGLSELVRGHEKVFLTGLDSFQAFRPE